MNPRYVIDLSYETNHRDVRRLRGGRAWREGRCFAWALVRSVADPELRGSRFRAHPGGAWWGVSRTELSQILIGGRWRREGRLRMQTIITKSCVYGFETF